MHTVELPDGRMVPAAKLLVALYERSSPQGLGIIAAAKAPPMTEELAENLIEGRFSFDYLYGRPIKIHAKDGRIRDIDIRLFDRDAGEGAFDAAVRRVFDGLDA